MKKKVKLILVIIFALFIVGFIFVKINQPLEIKTIVIEKKDIIRDFKEKATLESNDILSITPAYSDNVLFIMKAGNKVKKGELILSLDTKKLNYKKSELTAQINSLYGQEKMSNPKNIAIQMAQDVLTRTTNDKQKYNELYEQGAVSKTEYEMYLRAYEDAKNNLSRVKNSKIGTSNFYQSQRESIKSILDDIEEKLQNSDIYAPSDGVITQAFLQNGDMANPAMPIMKISSTNNLTAVCDIISSDALALKLSQKVKIIIKIGQETIKAEGTIISIADNATTKISSLGLEEQRVKVKVQSDEFKKLIVGCDMDIIFETMHLKNKLSVPKTAVFKIDELNHIWIVQNNKLAIKQIEIGSDSDYDYEVLSGLDEGDIIIIDSNNKDLKEGKKVKSQ